MEKKRERKKKTPTPRNPTTKHTHPQGGWDKGEGVAQSPLARFLGTAGSRTPRAEALWSSLTLTRRPRAAPPRALGRKRRQAALTAGTCPRCARPPACSRTLAGEQEQPDGVQFVLGAARREGAAAATSRERHGRKG